MRRILVSECKQEISSFNPVQSTYEDFFVERGDDVLKYHRPVRNEVGGALSVFDKTADLEIIGGYSARGITSAGTLSQDGFGRIAREFLDAVRNAGPLDGIYFALHGALAAEDVDDCEGYLLEETRKIVGDSMPISVSLDLHGILTDKMLQHSSAIAVFHTNPHVDFFETGVRAARLLLRVMDGEQPTMLRVPIPALVRGRECMTATGLIRSCMQKAIALEGGIFIGNPFTDVPDLCSNVFALGEDSAAKAEEIAREFWSYRLQMQQPLLSLEEAVRRASAATGRVVMVDAADATSSGASGDSNAIFAEWLRQGCSRTILSPIVDAPAVSVCVSAGPGATVTVDVGGALDARRFPPVRVTGEVVLVSDGKMRSESHGEEWFAGPTAVLQVGAATLVLTSRAVSLYDRSLFIANGLDSSGFDLVVVKSPLCQPRFFEDGAELVLNIDAPGATSANVKALGHTVARRPLFPLDDIEEYTPAARVFRRTA